jgi:hypothetical protein
MNITIHRIYWTEEGELKSESFGPDSIDCVLKRCADLRQQRIGGRDISFISTSSELPECVSLQGVAAPSPKYDWQKRRGGRK